MSLNERLLLHGAVIRYLYNLEELQKMKKSPVNCAVNLKAFLRLRKLVNVDSAMMSETKVSDLIPSDIFGDIRGSRTDSYFVAVNIVGYLTKRGVHCGVATIKSLTGAVPVWNDFTQEHKFYTSHTVVTIGEYVIDALNSDKLVKMPAYISSLNNSDISFTIENAASCLRAYRVA